MMRSNSNFLRNTWVQQGATRKSERKRNAGAALATPKKHTKKTLRPKRQKEKKRAKWMEYSRLRVGAKNVNTNPECVNIRTMEMWKKIFTKKRVEGKWDKRRERTKEHWEKKIYVSYEKGVSRYNAVSVEHNGLRRGAKWLVAVLTAYLTKNVATKVSPCQFLKVGQESSKLVTASDFIHHTLVGLHNNDFFVR